MSNPPVLLIHGVNSTGQWHDTTIQECLGVFECVPIKYRYYHGLIGGLKVYAWPTGLLLLLALGNLLRPENPSNQAMVFVFLLFAEIQVNRHAGEGRDRER